MAQFNILYLHESSRISGAEYSLLNLIKNLNKTRFKPFFILPEEGPFKEKLIKHKVEIQIIPLPKISRSLASFLTIKKIYELVREKNINLIHSNSIRTHIYASIVAKLKKIPLVWHERNLITKEFMDFDRLLSFLPDRIICNSYAIAKRFNISKKVHVIYNGVDIDKFSPKNKGEYLREEFKIPKDIPIVGIASRFGPDKGHEYFLKAARELIKEIKYVRFLIVGDAVFKEDEWRRDYLKKLTERLDLKEFVIFTGFREDMPSVFAVMDIVVLASYAEPCGRVLLEAQATGKPVIATNSGGSPEIVMGNLTGLLIPPKDYKKLAKAIKELLKDKKKRLLMGYRARQRVEKLFNIQKTASQIQKLYLDLFKLRRWRSYPA